MKRAIACLLAGCLMAAQSACAETIEANEPLVMRLIFEDCLGYVRHGRPPFGGLATRPASQAVVDNFPPLMPNRDQVVELLSPRYAAAWGGDRGARHCILKTVTNGEPSSGPGLLGVRPEGFIARVTERAVAVGLMERTPEDEFSPLRVATWSEPDTGHETGPLRPLRLALIPAARTEDGSLMDAGTIVMSGPPLAGR